MTTKRELEESDPSTETVEQQVLPVAKKQRTTTKKSLTQKEIKTKLDAATEQELRTYLKDILSAHGELLLPSFEAFTPKQLIRAEPDDPLLNTCFRCRTAENLSPIAECKICANCSSDMLGNHGNLTREKVMNIFKFSKNEALEIPFKTTQAGLFKNFTVYVYSLPAVLKAVKKKYGSLYLMLKERQLF